MFRCRESTFHVLSAVERDFTSSMGFMFWSSCLGSRGNEQTDRVPACSLLSRPPVRMKTWHHHGPSVATEEPSWARHCELESPVFSAAPWLRRWALRVSGRASHAHRCGIVRESSPALRVPPACLICPSRPFPHPGHADLFTVSLCSLVFKSERFAVPVPPCINAVSVALKLADTRRL